MIQRIINTIYRNPRGKLKLWKSFGGYLKYKKMLRAETQMKYAASQIYIEIPDTDLKTLYVSFLTGKKYWHQTVFCAYSLQKVTKFPIHFTFYDDGSFTPELIEIYRQQVPNSTFLQSAEIESRLEKFLPIKDYPYLHHKREVYKHIRKLTDVYAGKDGWQLMLDSDMIFWNEPIQLIEWLKSPDSYFYIQDIETAYGFPIAEMKQLTGQNIVEKINVGVIGLKGQFIDFKKLEHWAEHLEEKFGASYYLEQALTAMLIGNQPAEIGDQKEYIVYPTPEEILSQTGTLHHYVDLSKQLYLTKAWKKLI